MNDTHSLVRGVGLSFALASALVACGGSSAPAAPSSPPADHAAAAGSSSQAATQSSSSVTTDKGDLAGAKMESGSTTAVTTKSEGPAKPQAGGEVGRRREDIQARVVAHREEARKCYDDALKTHPGIEGNLVVKWIIDPTGKVTNAEVDDTKSQIHEPSVGKCIIKIIETLKFGESAKGFESRANYPFNFHPRGPMPASSAAAEKK